jgi:hypothetical protein
MIVNTIVFTEKTHMRLNELIDMPQRSRLLKKPTSLETSAGPDASLEDLGWSSNGNDYHTNPHYPGHKLFGYPDKVLHFRGMFPSKQVGTYNTPAEAHDSVAKMSQNRV